MSETVTVVPPNEDMVKVTRLYLEKYELLKEVDRELYRRILNFFSSPMMVMKESEEQK